MKTTFISKENNVAKFTIEYTAEEFEAAVIKVYQKNKDKFNIDGFRKGKAPRSIIEKHYGEGVFFEDAINELLGTGYPDAIKELDLEVIDYPKVDTGEVKKGEPLKVDITVDVYPRVEVKDYKNLTVEQVTPEVDEEQVTRRLEMEQKKVARSVPVDREAKNGDTITLDYAGFVGEEQFEGGTAENQKLTLGSGQFIPGFEDQLIGAKAGEEVDVKVTFPEEYHAENLAGKDAVFHCKVNEVREEQLPELDDEFAKDVSDFDTLEEMKNDIKAKLLETSEVRSLNEAKDNLVEQIYENNKFDPPQSMVQDELSRALSERDQQLRYQGITLQQFLQFTGVKLEDMMNEMKPEIEQRVASRILLRSIAEQEKLEVTDEDLDKELTRMAELYSSPEKKYDAEEMKNLLGTELESFKKDIIITKTIDYLYDNAKVKMVKAEEKKDKK
ncbi:MAG: trigger factor, partial [Firmicutes bacterium]|nr:trigger factor [Bacillota bacterium]